MIYGKTILGSALLLALGLMFGCGGGTANVNKTNTLANNANASKPANTAPANNTSTSNANSEKSEKMGNEDLDFMLINKTGYAIKGVSIGPSGEKDWTPADEVLKGRTFGDGASLDIKFHPKETAAKWDLKVDWEDGSPSVEWLGFDLTKIEKLTLKYDRAADKTTAEMEP